LEGRSDSRKVWSCKKHLTSLVVLAFAYLVLSFTSENPKSRLGCAVICDSRALQSGSLFVVEFLLSGAFFSLLTFCSRALF
jgi:hypothetical protein